MSENENELVKITLDDIAALGLTTPELMTKVVETVETVEDIRKTLVTLTEFARVMQAELANRGFKMEFSALSSPLDGEIKTVGPVTPSPGITEPIPEPEEEEVLALDAPEYEAPVTVQDNRTVTQIMNESKPTAAAVQAESADFQRSSQAEELSVINRAFLSADKILQRKHKTGNV